MPDVWLPHEKSLNTVRSLILKKMVEEDARLTAKSKVDLSRLAHCRDNLVLHIQRVNHCLAFYKRAGQAIFWRPKPHDIGQGREKNDSGSLEPIWSSSPILPPSLVDLIEPSRKKSLTLKKKQTRNLTLARSSTVMRMIEACFLQNPFL